MLKNIWWTAMYSFLTNIGLSQLVILQATTPLIHLTVWATVIVQRKDCLWPNGVTTNQCAHCRLVPRIRHSMKQMKANKTDNIHQLGSSWLLIFIGWHKTFLRHTFRSAEIQSDEEWHLFWTKNFIFDIRQHVRCLRHRHTFSVRSAWFLFVIKICFTPKGKKLQHMVKIINVVCGCH